MPKRNSPSKVARNGHGRPQTGTDAQRRAGAALELRRREALTSSGETEGEAPLKTLSSLNWRQRMFVRMYLGECKGNATEAARRAGYTDPELAGWRLRQNEVISRAIEAPVTEAGLSADEILADLAEMASFDVTPYMGPDGHLDIARLVADGKANMIQAIIPTANGVTYKLYSRKEALELLGKYRKLFTDRIAIEGFDPAGMSTEELKAFIAQKGRQGP